MIKNYIKIAYRNLIKNRLFSLINITGMTIGMASFLIISIFVWDELKYDDHHQDKERTFRIYNIRTGDDGEVNYLPIVPPVFATKFQEEFPEVESTLRILDTYGEVMFNIDGNKFFERKVAYAEPKIFDILSIGLIKGNEETALSEKGNVVISESFAEKHFDEDPLGKVIQLDQGDFTVS